ncbi:MAG: phosphate/phosphite/phosphonate ABC transporter substrate-binding protein [Leptolyngbyaceae cyanobacterium CSU_1_3]|nr:phosphate/phosphite/phosphonate ABC transporter substrate-binding protein [Leptolyngbyaceae cyanobacterium CSU_1_3]
MSATKSVTSYTSLPWAIAFIPRLPRDRPALRVALLGLTIALASGCTQTPTAQAPTSSSKPAALRISVQPTKDKTEQERMIAPLEAHLEKVLGQQVDFLVAKDYKESVDMLVDGRTNAAYAGVVSYFEALERGVKVEPLVAPIDKYTARPWYRSCIIVAANSPIKTLSDLKGKRVAFVNRSSTSGYLMPLAALKQLKIDPDRDFAQVMFGGTHAQTEALLGANQVDAIATNLATYSEWKKLGKLTAQDSKVLWESSPVPHAPVLVSQDLPPELIEKLKEAFLTTPPGIQDLMGAETAGYTLVDGEDYESIQQLRLQLNFAEKGSTQ